MPIFQNKCISIYLNIKKINYKTINHTLFNPSTDLKIIKANPLERPVAGSVFRLILVISPY